MRLLLTCLLATILLVSCNGKSGVYSEKDLYARSQAFADNQDETHLRELLNTQSDGATGYLHMALIGEAFGKHPDAFERISSSLVTAKERWSFQMLREHGNGVFEYYPDLKPAQFDEVYRKAAWLK